MNGTILVTYASRAGSTAETAEAIARALEEDGANVEVLPMKAVTDLSRYAAVAAGSAIRGGKWLPEAMEFVRAHRDELGSKPFAAFMVCITLAMPNSGQYRAGLAQWMAPVRALVRPVSEGMFAGVLNFKRLSFFEGLGMRIAALAGIFPADDRRDWAAVTDWAREIRPLLAR